jgi:hypothetical protein
LQRNQTGYEKGAIQKMKIIQTEIFSVDEHIKIISGIIAIMGKRRKRVRKEDILSTFMLMTYIVKLRYLFL